MIRFLGVEYTRKQLIRDVSKVTGVKEEDVTVIIDFADLILLEKAYEGRTLTIGKIGRLGFTIQKGRRTFLSLVFQPRYRYTNFKKMLQKQYRKDRKEAERAKNREEHPAEGKTFSQGEVPGGNNGGRRQFPDTGKRQEKTKVHPVQLHLFDGVPYEKEEGETTERKEVHHENASYRSSGMEN